MGSRANPRGVYRSGTVLWLNTSPRRSSVKIRKDDLATATKPSGHCSEAKPAHAATASPRNRADLVADFSISQVLPSKIRR